MAYGSESDEAEVSSVQSAIFAEPGITAKEQKENPVAQKTTAETVEPVPYIKKYVCSVVGCNARFTRPWRLRAHESVHTGEKPFACDEEGCTKAYAASWHLRRHKLQSHSSEPSNKKDYKCTHPGCDKVLKTSQSRNKHYKRSHENIGHTCSYCKERFRKHSQLRAHLFQHTGIAPFKCRQCDVGFLMLNVLRRHERKHLLHICPEHGCDQVFKNWSLTRKHMLTHKTEFICFYCSKTFKLKTALRRHIVWHVAQKEGIKQEKTIKKKYTCYLCDLELSTKGSVKRHIKVIHAINPVVRPAKPKKPRAKRKDAGVPKRCLAGLLSAVPLPQEVNMTLINKDAFGPEPEIVSSVLKQIKEQSLLTSVEDVSSEPETTKIVLYSARETVS